MAGVFAAPTWSYLAGMQLSNDVGTPNTKLDISAGFAVDSTQTTGIVLPAFTKTISGTWVAGTGNAGMGTGLTAAASTWYHVFSAVISGVPDVFFDTSAVAAHAPAGTGAFRRIGSILTDASVHILAFIQDGDSFLWKSPVLDINGVTGTALAQNLSTLSVPLGVNTFAVGYGQGVFQTTTDGLTAYAPDIGNQSGNALVTGLDAIEVKSTSTNVTCYFNIRTNTSSQIAWICTNGNAKFFWTTMGWVDRRGRDN